MADRLNARVEKLRENFQAEHGLSVQALFLLQSCTLMNPFRSVKDILSTRHLEPATHGCRSAKT